MTTPTPEPSKIGARWTDTSMIEPAWLRDVQWTIAAATPPGEVRSWVLGNQREDGGWVDATVGLVRVDGVQATGVFLTRGWVTRSGPVEIDVERVRGAGQISLIRVSVKHPCEGGAAGGHWFFVLDSGSLEPLGEVEAGPTVDCGWSGRIVTATPPAFESTVDGNVFLYHHDGERWAIRR